MSELATYAMDAQGGLDQLRRFENAPTQFIEPIGPGHWAQDK